MQPEFERMMEQAKEIGWLRAQLKIHAWRIQDAIRADDIPSLGDTAESMICISEKGRREIMKEITNNMEENHAIPTRNDNR